jgi:hypothetical protein
VSSTEAAPKRIGSTIPARLDRPSWSPFHTRMVAGLGAAWILDGLQITIASSVTGVLIQPVDSGVELSTIYAFAAGIAFAMGAWSFVVARRPSPASLHPVPD